MIEADQVRARYEETPYQDYVARQFDVARLLGLARLFGLCPGRDAGPLRVLDLGCASGLHVRTQAVQYPDVEFVGVDFTGEELDRGRTAIAEEGLTNVELIESDLRELAVEPARFDLILCSGTFSWVPDDVKEGILNLARSGLKPTGVAAVTYLTYPGWKLRESLRELLMLRVAGTEDPAERVRESARMLRFLQTVYKSNTTSPMAQVLTRVVEGMQTSSSNVFVHDELSRDHDPCYFLEFVEWADECGLHYLAEAELCTMRLMELPQEAEPMLQELAPSFLETQQWIDFLVNRSGRSSLLVREDAKVSGELERDALRELSFGLTAPVVELLPSEERVTLEDSSGLSVTLEAPGFAALADALRSEAPAPLSFIELQTALDGQVDEEVLLEHLLHLIGYSLIDPVFPISTDVS